MASNVEQKTQGTDPFVLRQNHRLVTVWSTNMVSSEEENIKTQGLSNALYFGRYTKFIESSEKHLPSILDSELISSGEIQVESQNENVLSNCRLITLKLPNGNVLVLFELFVDCDFKSLIDLMQDCYYKKVKIKGESIEAWLRNKVGLVHSDKSSVFDDAYYQYVSLRESDAADEIDYQKMRSIIYRYVDDGQEYREQFREKVNSEIYPPALNLRKQSACVVSNYVGVVYNHQEYIESTMILSILQYVASQQVLTTLRGKAFEILQDLGDQAGKGIVIDGDMPKLVQLAKHLELLNLELSLGVEEPMDLGLILPSLRPQVFHNTLFQVGGTEKKIENFGRMLTRMENVLNSNKSMMHSYEQEKATLRSRVWAVIASTITLIAIPVTIILAFFSAPVIESPKGVSIFDLSLHWQLYLVVFGVFLMSFLVGGIIWGVIQIRKHKKRRQLFEDVQSFGRRKI